MADKVQSDVVVGGLGPARSHPDYYAVRVANCILGQFGMMGRLGERVREELGLAYYCYSAMLAEEQAGTWLAAAGVAPANVEATVASVLAEFERLGSQPVTDQELADTQAYLTGIVPLALETNQGVAGTLFNMELYGLGLDYLARYPALITSVTADEVQRVAAAYLQPGSGRGRRGRPGNGVILCCAQASTSSKSSAFARRWPATASASCTGSTRPDELICCRNRLESLAARFAAKEAVTKALGTGVWRKGIGWVDVEVLRDDVTGAPVLHLHGAAARLAQQLGLTAWSVSLSHDRTRAVAFVVALNE